MNRFRRLLTRWDKKAKHYLAFVQLACLLILWRKFAPLSGQAINTVPLCSRHPSYQVAFTTFHSGKNTRVEIRYSNPVF